MRCICCDRMLSNKESTAKYASTGEYADTCFKCMGETGIPYLVRDNVEEGDADDIEDIIEEEFDEDFDEEEER